MRKSFKQIMTFERRFDVQNTNHREMYCIADLHNLDYCITDLFKLLKKLTNKEEIKNSSDLDLIIKLQDLAEKTLIQIIDLKRFDQYNLDEDS